jgi:hypothetical protein
VFCSVFLVAGPSAMDLVQQNEIVRNLERDLHDVINNRKGACAGVQWCRSRAAAYQADMARAKLLMDRWSSEAQQAHQDFLKWEAVETTLYQRIKQEKKKQKVLQEMYPSILNIPVVNLSSNSRGFPIYPSVPGPIFTSAPTASLSSSNVAPPPYPENNPPIVSAICSSSSIITPVSCATLLSSAFTANRLWHSGGQVAVTESASNSG